MKKIAVVLSYPLCTRNFIHSGLLNDLTGKGFKVKIISPYIHEYFVDEWGNKFHNTPVRTIGYDPWGTPLIEGAGLFHKFLFSVRMRGYSIEYPDGSLQTMDLCKPNSVTWFLAWVLVKLFPRRSAARRQLRKWYDKIGPENKTIKAFLESEKPDLLITSTMGHLPVDFVSLTTAIRLGIKTACILLSWDNLYSRGPVYKHPDLLLVWSRIMVEQAIKVHQFEEKDVKAVGPLQFVNYAGELSEDELSVVRKKFSLNEGEKYILVVCGARTPKYDIEDINRLVELVRSSEFRRHRIIVRPHPQVDGIKYDEIKHLVDIDYSPSVNSDPDKLFKRADVRYMAALLSQAEYVVSSWGTTVLLEACLFDKKVVQLNWYATVEHEDEWQKNAVAKFQRYYHMREFDEYNGRLKSESPNDLLSRFRDLESRNNYFSENRRRIRKDFTGGEYDKVTGRILLAITDLIVQDRNQS